jgi:5-methylcytosine-specific restriction endonuclease McrA
MPEETKRRTFFKWDAKTRTDDAIAAATETSRQQRDVYAKVNLRERYRCRICRAYCNPHAVSLLDRGHHHHIVFRSAGGATTTENVILVDSRCHNDIHKHRIAVEGNAEKAITVKRRMADTNEWYIARQELAPNVWMRD